MIIIAITYEANGIERVAEYEFMACKSTFHAMERALRNFANDVGCPNVIKMEVIAE